ncbi:MAG TPA: AraC family transcriptional regulator [Polyangiaceae bacterium]|nr:AraC family transcriptional regulator [Polyangiaceae bacterium]
MSRDRCSVPLPARGILGGESPEGYKQGVRVPPPPSLAAYIHHFWFVRWALSRPLAAAALSYPTVVLTFEEHAGVKRAEITGPLTERLTKRLSGEGLAFGITFRPGAFSPLFEGRMAALANRTLALVDVFGAEGGAWADAIFEERDLDGRIERATEFLERRLPPMSAEVRRVRDIVEQMATNRSLLRVEDVCVATGLDLRTLQRRFQQRVGVSPKWALRRFRMLEVVEQLKAPDRPSLAQLAASLRYADQAHFAREFKRVVGETPSRFVQYGGVV